MNYQKLAEQAVAEYSPEARARHSFAYYGDLPLGETWAGTFDQSRDSGALERSNFRTISDDLATRFPDDVRDERSSHWAVGWTDTLYVRMLDEHGQVTDAGCAALEWKRTLENYPVADDMDFSEEKTKDENEAWENCYRTDLLGELEKRFPFANLDGCSAEAIDDLAGRSELEWEHDSGVAYCRPKVEEIAADLELERVLATPGATLDTDALPEPLYWGAEGWSALERAYRHPSRPTDAFLPEGGEWLELEPCGEWVARQSLETLADLTHGEWLARHARKAGAR